MSHLQTETVIDNRFVIKGIQRHLTFYTVYQAVDRNTNAGRSLLVIPQIVTKNPEAINILHSAFRDLPQLDSPNIAKVYAFHDSGPVCYVESEYLDGETLRVIKLNSPDKRLPEDKLIVIARRLLNGLAHAHEMGVLHRDINPDNMMITRDYQVKLVDFSIAEALYRSLNLVQEATPRQSILYMSPEQARGMDIDIRSDIYAFGAVLYELAGGSPPFTYGDIYNQIIHEKPARIETASNKFNRVLLKCLEKEPKRRYQNCSELSAELDKLKEVSPADKTEDADTEEVEKDKPVNKIIQKISEIKSKADRKIVIYSATIAVLLTLIISLAAFNMDTFVKMFEGARNEPLAELSEEEKDKVKAFKEKADSLFEAGQKISPYYDNALNYYKKVLDILPNERHALASMEQIRQHYLYLAEEEIKKGNVFRAGQIVNEALQTFEEDPDLMKLKKELVTNQDFAIKIEILNGAGEAGIAARLAAKLNSHDFQVVSTDNFLRNGSVYWGVPETRMITILPENEQLDRLSRLINVKYSVLDEHKMQSEEANVSIILGHNYSSLPPFE